MAAPLFLNNTRSSKKATINLVSGYGIFVATLLFLSSAMAQAEANIHTALSCYSGSWQYDKKASDSYKRITKKLKRRLRLQQRADYEQRFSKIDPNASVDLPTLPQYALLQEDIRISQTAAQLLQFTQASFNRQVDFSGVSHSKSLSQLQQQSSSQIASIEADQLVIETRNAFGIHITESWQLLSDGRLQHSVKAEDDFHKTIRWQRFFKPLATQKACGGA